MMITEEEKIKLTANCTCCSIWLLINAVFGAISFDYVLWFIWGKNIPFFADIVCGLFVGQFTIPLAIVFWILKLCGIEAPLMG